MATITVSHLTFAYDGGNPLFDDVSLRLDTRWKIGLIGRNGRGKTTLLRLLLKQEPFGGTIDAPVPLDYFPYTITDECRTTFEVAESIATFEPWQIERELSLLAVSEDVLTRPFATLSGGEKTKVLLAAMFLNENRFLLIDEPTNHLDLEGRESVADYLNGKSGFILVSHDRTLLDRCVDHVLSINRSDVELIRGNFSTWQQNRDYRDKFETAENRKLRKEIKRMGEASKRSADWSNNAEKEKYGNGPVNRGFLGAKAAGIMSRSKAADARRQKSIEEKSKLFKNIEIEDDLSLVPMAFHSKRLLDLSGVSIHYEPENPLFENLSLSVDAGDRIALCGRNGCGKSSLLKLIAGQDVPHSGRVAVPQSLKISYIPQDASFLKGPLRSFIEDRGLDESLFRSMLHKLGFRREDVENDMSGFSAGQKRKVLLAASLCDRTHLYLWDEPLNYIDVISRIQIEKLLLEREATVIFIEHDRSFLDAVATKRIVLSNRAKADANTEPQS